MIDMLLVDDSSITRSVIKRIIRLSGADVGTIFEAEDGVDALEKLKEQWVDIIISDINMPRMNGFQLVSELKSDPIKKNIPIIMITTEGSEKRINELKAKGINEYIIKPFYPEQVKDAIEKCMAGRGT